LTLNGISKRAFDSDVQVGAPSAGRPPGYMSVPYYTKIEYLSVCHSEKRVGYKITLKISGYETNY